MIDIVNNPMDWDIKVYRSSVSEGDAKLAEFYTSGGPNALAESIEQLLKALNIECRIVTA